MDKKKKKYTHVNVRDEQGNDFLCPAESLKGSADNDVDVNVCFERDVPGRYAALIKVRES